MQVIQGKVPIKMWTDDVPVESVAIDQLRNTASLPFIFKHLAVMPDVHLGRGATVGSVVPTKGAVIPAAVGVDIGCGMAAVKTGLTAEDLPDNLKGLRRAIETAVPHGFGKDASHNGGGWNVNELPRPNTNLWRTKLETQFDNILSKHPTLKGRNIGHYVSQIGSLGSGNHFVEVCLDEDNIVWVMLHSGSRGVGNKIGSYFTKLAKEDMRVHFINLPDKDLAYLSEGTQHFDDYIEAVEWAQGYAKYNRGVMMKNIFSAINQYEGIPQKRLNAQEMVVECHHNYISREYHYGENIFVTRKGAVQAREGTMGIIPGSMGTRSYIVRGKGNAESFNSCSHGAGRRMSRGEAKRTFTLDDHIRDTDGVECRKDEGVLDETPLAYKNIDNVMSSQTDLVDIVHTLKAVLCVKG